jgi:predicted metal-binding membrane protein
MHTSRAQALPVAIPAAIALAWCIAIAAQLSGSAGLLHHDHLIERDPSKAIALALFVLAWLVMIAAMMLPSSLPLMRMFAAASSGLPRYGFVMCAFLSGYVLVWSVFGVLAFGGDVLVHGAVDRIAWLAQHPWLVSAAILAAAGAFQFTPLKDACLRACRLPSNFLMQHYGRGAAAAFRLGYKHGIFCVGCCWALMLITFAAGFANLWWMAALTALMVFEKTAPRGRTAVPIAGAILLTWSALVFAHPVWLPHALSGI